MCRSIVWAHPLYRYTVKVVLICGTFNFCGFRTNFGECEFTSRSEIYRTAGHGIDARTPVGLGLHIYLHVTLNRCYVDCWNYNLFNKGKEGNEEYSNYFGKGKKTTVHLNTKWWENKSHLTCTHLWLMHVWHHMKSNMNEQWDLGGHKYAHKINHQLNFEFSCDFQGKKYYICYYFNFFELFLNIIHKTP